MSVTPGHNSATVETAPPFFSGRLSAAYILQFLFIGLYTPFFPVWLEYQALTPIEISTVLAFPLLVRVLATVPMMWVADYHPDRAKLFSMLYTLAMLAMMGFLAAGGFWEILIISFIFHFFFNGLLPILDAITLSGVRRFDADYGRIRIWGSIAFILANLGGGWLIADFQAPAILWTLMGTVSVGLLISFSVPRIGRSVRPIHRLAGAGSARALIADQRFVMTATAIGLGQAAHALLYGFGTIYWQSLGFGGAAIGALWAIGVMTEIALFQVAKGLLRCYGAVLMIAIGLTAGAIRWAFFPVVTEYWPFFALQILHGLSFGAVHIGSMQFIMESVPEERLGTGQAVVYVASGALMGILIFLAGPIYETFSADGFWLMGAVCLIGLALLLRAASPDKGTEQG